MDENLRERAARASCRMAAAVPWLAAAIVVVSGAVALWFIAVPSDAEAFIAARYGVEANLVWSSQVVGLVSVGLLNIGLAVAGLLALARAFDIMASDDPFSPAGVVWLRRSGWLILLGTVVAIAARSAVTVLATVANEPGQRTLSVGLSGADAMALLAAGALIAFAHIHALAVAVHDDSKAII